MLMSPQSNVFGSLNHMNKSFLLTMFQQIRSIISKKVGPFEQVQSHVHHWQLIVSDDPVYINANGISSQIKWKLLIFHNIPATLLHDLILTCNQGNGPRVYHWNKLNCKCDISSNFYSNDRYVPVVVLYYTNTSQLRIR